MLNSYLLIKLSEALEAPDGSLLGETSVESRDDVIKSFRERRFSPQSTHVNMRCLQQRGDMKYNIRSSQKEVCKNVK